MTLDKEAERIARAEYTGGFEKEYVLDSSQIVKFPTNMGLQGLTFKYNAVAYANGCLSTVKS